MIAASQPRPALTCALTCERCSTPLATGSNRPSTPTTSSTCSIGAVLYRSFVQPFTARAGAVDRTVDLFERAITRPGPHAPRRRPAPKRS